VTDQGRVVCLVLEQLRGHWWPLTVAAVPVDDVAYAEEHR
jgi:hypothetical protein